MTIPNIVSGIRILLVPLFLWLLLARDDPAAAGWLLLGIGATDWVDGYLARRLDQVSSIGKILDPTADRLAVGAAVIGGWIAGVLPWPVALAIAVREVLVTTVAAVLAIRLKTALEVRWVGKAGTFGLYGAIASFFVHAGSGHDVFLWLAWGSAIPALVFYYVSAVMYVGDARRLIATGPSVSSDRSST
ncbi:MAG: CDP-alcohol phosphatidyltransferase family protein [Acidimicrobiia bacterium]